MQEIGVFMAVTAAPFPDFDHPMYGVPLPLLAVRRGSVLISIFVILGN
jgi:hypothetical protein